VSTPTADAGTKLEPGGPPTRAPRAAGTIYDLGYQRYAGDRLGRLNAVRTLFTFSLRTAYGLGRGDRSKLIPGGILLVVFLPAIIQIGVASATGRPEFINYAGHLQFTALLLALFAAAQAPEMIVTDRQHGVLSLYLSRPLTGTDYAFAKLAALAGAMLVLTLGPQLLLFLGKVFMVAAPWTALKAEWRKLLPIVGGTVVTSVFMASIGLALASLASRRAFASAGVIAFFLFLAAASTLIRSLATGQVRRYMVLVNPAFLMTGFANWLFDIESKRRSIIGRADLPGKTYLYTILTACVVCVLILWLRFRRSEA
jgi:ABC-2 type transport system permease protein